LGPSWRVVGVVLAKVEIARSIGAGWDTVPATDALVVIDFDDAIGSLVCSVDRTDPDAGWVVTLHAGAWDETPGDVRVLADLLLENRPVHEIGRAHV
jgi:formylmethanofuran dehydrogenase subunit E-like metal-binding protein